MNSFFSIVSKIKNWFGSLGLLAKGVVILVVLGAIWWGYTKSTSTAEVSYQFAKVERGNVIQTTEETGEVVATNKTNISSTVTGIVSQVYVTNGQMVKRGDKLFYVKSTATEAERSQALAAYQGAKATLEQAQASQHSLQSKMFTEWDQYMQKTNEDEYEDTNSSFRVLPGFQSTQKDWLAAEAEYKAQNEVLAKARASLNEAWLNYQATVDAPVKATADGTVANISIAAGQSVVTSDTALIIKSDSQYWVKVGLNESDITQVKVGQKAEVSVDALGDEKFPAIVQRVDEFGTVVSDVVVYYVYLTLDQADEHILPAMTVQVSITTQEKNDVLLVPATALKPYQGEKAVQVLDQTSNAAIYKPVTVGIQDDVNVEVLDGLQEGEEVIIGTNASSSTSNSSGGFFRRPD